MDTEEVLCLQAHDHIIMIGYCRRDEIVDKAIDMLMDLSLALLLTRNVIQNDNYKAFFFCYTKLFVSHDYKVIYICCTKFISFCSHGSLFHVLLIGHHAFNIETPCPYSNVERCESCKFDHCIMLLPHRSCWILGLWKHGKNGLSHKKLFGCSLQIILLFVHSCGCIYMYCISTDLLF